MEPCSRRLAVLPEEMILEILYRVPAKSLVRFRCVSKSWKTLISSPEFVKDYGRTSFSITTITQQQRLACMTHFGMSPSGRRELTTCSLQSLLQNPIHPPPETSRIIVERRWGVIIGSCNGLLCLDDGHGYFNLRNPFTRLASKRSPPLFPYQGYRLRIKETMAMYGFGYDQVNDKYKLLFSYHGITQVYTFGTKSWTTIQTFPPCLPPLHWSDRLGKFMSSSSGSGTLNWLVGGSDRIISFDLEKETYGQVLLPDMDGELPFNLEVLSNRLCLCYVNDIRCVLWSYGIQESWTMLILIPHPIRFHDMPVHPLSISENGLVLMEVNNLQLVLYNALNGKLAYPRITTSRGETTHIYNESSVSPL